MKNSTCSRYILTPCFNPLTHTMLYFLPADTYKEDNRLIVLEGGTWIMAHGGPKSPRLLTQGLWNLAASSKIVKWLESTRVAHLSLSEERHLCPPLFLTYLILLLIDRFLPVFLYLFLTLVLLNHLWECEYYCLKDNSRVWQDIRSQLWLSKSLCCSAASNTTGKGLDERGQTITSGDMQSPWPLM